MPLAPHELEGIRHQATVFETGYGRSLAALTPTAVVARMRGARFEVCCRNGTAYLWPHYSDDWIICDGVVWDLVQATGCTDRVSYMELLETIGHDILARLTEDV